MLGLFHRFAYLPGAQRLFRWWNYVKRDVPFLLGALHVRPSHKVAHSMISLLSDLPICFKENIGALFA